MAKLIDTDWILDMIDKKWDQFHSEGWSEKTGLSEIQFKADLMNVAKKTLPKALRDIGDILFKKHV